MPNDLFDSTNPYTSLEVISARTPQELIRIVKEIKTPIKIVNIIPWGNRLIAFIMGDIRVKRTPGRPKKTGE